DYMNRVRACGLARDAAILEANRVRLRPILMTTMMLVLGMIPIALGQGPGAGSRSSIARVIVGGQMLSLVITLLITPVAYSLFDDLGRTTVPARVMAWVRAASATARRWVGARAGLGPRAARRVADLASGWWTSGGGGVDPPSARQHVQCAAAPLVEVERAGAGEMRERAGHQHLTGLRQADDASRHVEHEAAEARATARRD